MVFSNDQVDIGAIPSILDVTLQHLDRRYLKVEMLWAVLISMGILGATGSVLYADPMEFPGLWRWGIFGAVVLLVILILVTTYLGFWKKAYAIRERDVIYQHGLVWRDYVVVPYHRIQHVDVQQGPIERFFELAQLNVYTAGGSSSDVSISGLSFDQAQSLKHYILRQSLGHEEE